MSKFRVLRPLGQVLRHSPPDSKDILAVDNIDDIVDWKIIERHETTSPLTTHEVSGLIRAGKIDPAAIASSESAKVEAKVSHIKTFTTDFEILNKDMSEFLRKRHIKKEQLKTEKGQGLRQAIKPQSPVIKPQKKQQEKDMELE